MPDWEESLIHQRVMLPSGAWQTGDLGCQEPHELQQRELGRPAPREEPAQVPKCALSLSAKSSLGENDLRVLKDTIWNVSQTSFPFIQCCEAISNVLGPVLGSHYRTDMDILERVQWRPTRMIRGLGHEERLRKLELFSLEKGRFWRDLIKICKNEGQVTGRGCKLSHFPGAVIAPEAIVTNWNSGDFLNIRKHFFTVRLTEHWHKLPKEIVGTFTLEIFKSHLDMVLGKWL